jgi:hypothetical protein
MGSSELKRGILRIGVNQDIRASPRGALNLALQTPGGAGEEQGAFDKRDWGGRLLTRAEQL